MADSPEQRPAFAELLDQTGAVIHRGRVAAFLRLGQAQMLTFEASAEMLDRAWSVRLLAADGTEISTEPTALGSALGAATERGA